MKIKLGDILIDDRKRVADPAKVSDLAASIREIGLLHPVVLTPDNRLVGGLHRIEAFKLLSMKYPDGGYDEIEYTVKDYDTLHAELAEIDENIQRSDPTYLERGNMMLRRKEIWESLHPESKVGGDKKSPVYKAKKSEGKLPESFAKDTARKIGLTERSVHQEMQIARVLSPQVQEKAKEISLPKSDALRLSKERDPAFQKMIIDRIAQRKAANVREAKDQIKLEKEISRGREAAPDEMATFQIGDARASVMALPGESIKAIITHIPRGVDLPLFFGEASRILVPGGILALMVDPDYLEQVVESEKPLALHYRWILSDTLIHVEQPVELVQSAWMPIVIYMKDGSTFKISSDLIQKAIDSLRADEDHSIQVIGKFTIVGDTVLDPFLGRKIESYLAPAIGRKFIGVSSDQSMIDSARSHLEKVKEVIAAS